MTVPFPMPNDEIDGRLVIASVDYVDDLIATVLLLNPEPPFFSVGHYAYGDDPLAPKLEIIGGSTPETHHNIVPAVRAYENWGGDY